MLVRDAISAIISSMLTLPAEEILPTRPLIAYGLDSLVSVEIRNWMAREMDTNMALLDLMSTNSISQLAESVVRKSRLLNRKLLMKKPKHSSENGE